MVYKSKHSASTGPHRYCPRCDRAYDLEENEQIPNWAWEYKNGRWIKFNEQEAVEGDL